MTTTVVTQQGILAAVRPLVAGARRRVWVTAPWITSGAAALLFDELVTRLGGGEQLDVRIVYRLKGSDDLTISDLVALDRLAAAGCQVRYSNRLHAKLVLVDDEAAVVSSSNVTASAGYATSTGDWQNEELGLALDGEPGLVADLAREFAQIWDAAQELRPETLGIVLDPTTAAGMRVACMREPVVGEFVTLGHPEQLVGQVTAVAAWNPSVPAELGAEEAQLGLRGGGGGTRTKVPDVATLFSHPSKAHAFLMAQTFVQTSATY